VFLCYGLRGEGGIESGGKMKLINYLILSFFLGFIADYDVILAQNLSESGQKTFWSWAETPPMGWNSWDCYGPTVTEKEVKANADYMAKHLKNYGWQYIIVDIRCLECGLC
jgi:hypothetical protein